jgi:hypothetical protein
MPQFDPNTYVDVQTRIGRFWAEHANGAIRTSLVSDPDDWERCRYRAEVYKDAASAYPDATGYAFEVAGGRGPNATSHEENCETSAIGRALANMGYATSGADRPSRQEMTKVAARDDHGAPAQPSAPRPMSGPSEKQMGFIRKLARDLKLSDEQLNAYVEKEYGAPIDALQGRDVSNLIDRMKAKVDAG